MDIDFNGAVANAAGENKVSSANGQQSRSARRWVCFFFPVHSFPSLFSSLPEGQKMETLGDGRIAVEYWVGA